MSYCQMSGTSDTGATHLRRNEDQVWQSHNKGARIGLLLTMLLTLIVGFENTYRILGQPPLSVLRHE